MLNCFVKLNTILQRFNTSVQFKMTCRSSRALLYNQNQHSSIQFNYPMMNPRLFLIVT